MFAIVFPSIRFIRQLVAPVGRELQSLPAKSFPIPVHWVSYDGAATSGKRRTPSEEGRVESQTLLDELAVDAYRSALRAGVFIDERIATELGVDRARIAEARKALQGLRLLSQGGEGPAVPLDPEVVEVELIAPLEMSVARQRRQIAGIHRQLSTLSTLYRSVEHHQGTDVSIRVLDNAADVRREIDLARRRCTKERMSLQPGGGRSAHLLQSDLVQTQELLRRGVRVRTLYQHTARSSLTTRSYVAQISEAGAEVRTSAELSERLIVYDRRTAFVPKERKGSEPPGAAVVTDPTLVAYLCRSFEAAWQVGRPFTSTEPADQQQVSAELRSSILRLMAMGLKDEVIARRLGMAARTCRRYISALMTELGATSRFQAGVLLGRQAAENSAAGGVDSVTGDVQGSGANSVTGDVPGHDPAGEELAVHK
ncbi:helix-turn-helix transcriptional regulator [Streptomyces sp. wa22]|uniref:helix-turn-helix transcriptional regulator n=1 Tax=Streptomyces sp. wa22 TaxID=1828244 RepID=UPI0011CB9116|nr:LuxR C-terminal-related transcriptional regulator [Streptomyces sp. wa22]